MYEIQFIGPEPSPRRRNRFAARAFLLFIEISFPMYRIKDSISRTREIHPRR